MANAGYHFSESPLIVLSPAPLIVIPSPLDRLSPQTLYVSSPHLSRHPRSSYSSSPHLSRPPRSSYSSSPRKRGSSESQFKWIPGQAGDDGLLAGFAWHHGISRVPWGFRSAMGLPGHHGISGVPRGGAGAPRGFPGAMNVAPTTGNFCAFSIIFEMST